VPFVLPERRVAVMGVLNVTPDSFSDGGRFFEPNRALDRAREMVAEGADVIDVGGESTRPGAESVTVEEELRRTVGIVASLASEGVAVSIDTSKPEVANACLDAGALIVNDVTALRNDDMKRVCADAACTVCLMHMKGDPRTMQTAPAYEDVVGEVKEELDVRAQNAIKAGVARHNIWIDPGIGFGKTVEHNLRLLKGIGELVALGYPVLVGVSRKSFIGRLLGPESAPLPVEERLVGSLAAQTVAQMNGVRIVRTHDVAATRGAARVVQAILSPDSGTW
jgi:dihydropteroate synthase